VSDEPWESYSKALLPKALAYPVGRDVIQRQLTLAGARATSLSLGRPDRHSADTVIDIYWTGDVAQTVGGVVPPGGAVYMSLLAVPSDQKQVSGAGVVGQVAHGAYRLTRLALKLPSVRTNRPYC